LVDVQIRGGAGPYEAAALAAVIERVLSEEAAAAQRPPSSPTLPTWVAVPTTTADQLRAPLPPPATP